MDVNDALSCLQRLCLLTARANNTDIYLNNTCSCFQNFWNFWRCLDMGGGVTRRGGGGLEV